MGYFAENYSKLSYPTGSSGFRAAQLAAVQAVAAHFFSSKAPAIVVMPTGSGKTVVATALSYVLKAQRVLIITPSRLLREQIAEKFETMTDLESIGALDLLTPRPRVRNQRNRIKDLGDWNALSEYDVVVSTVFSISGIKADIPDIPSGLFDLVIVDEGHHAPAATWSKALSMLSGARQVLLTATPFRRDAKDIQGKIVFTYDVRRAYEDKIFGDLTFLPAVPSKGEDIDLAIARQTEQQFQNDAAAGWKHLVMVRVDGLARGKELQSIYAKTSLNLEFVSGQSSLKVVKKINADLREGRLDGIICVNMFGEGFDLPRLKIAALHSPHKSLAVTLQFIGRFARTNDPKVGRATFVAYAEEQRKEIQDLWTSSAVWPEIVHNVSSLRIEHEEFSRAVLESFESETVDELKDVPLSAIAPFFHAKIFRCFGDVDLQALPISAYDRQVMHSSYSEEFNTSIVIKKYVRRPKWISDVRVEDVTHHLDVIYYDTVSRLLFVGSTDKGVRNYHDVTSLVTDGKVKELSSSQVNKALNDIEGLTIFNLGMRRKQFGGRAESYRIVAGPGADSVVSDLDSQSYNRGHSFGKGRLDGKDITIGISTSSKIWSNTVDQIPVYVAWCGRLAKQLASRAAKPTGSGIDKLSAGQPLDAFPDAPVYAYYHEKTYMHLPVCFDIEDGEARAIGSLVDFDIKIVEADEEWVHFRLLSDARSWDGIFSLNAFPAVTAADLSEDQLHVGRSDDLVLISDYLSEAPPHFLLENFDAVEDGALFAKVSAGEQFDSRDFEIVDWSAAKINIEVEKPLKAKTSTLSIFEWMENTLLASSASFIFNDDGSGEVADFISLTQEDGSAILRLFHCKASGSSTPGSRLADLYEVCGQSIRSGIWLSGTRLADRLDHRLRNTNVIGLVRGSVETLRAAFSAGERHKLRLEVVIVQPGISQSKLKEMPEQLLVTTKHSAVAAGFSRLYVIGSV